MSTANPAPASHHDTIVVGGGAAGCALAARLSAAGDRTVLLIEAGPDDAELARAMAEPGRLPPGADWRLTARVPGWRTEFPLPRIRAVGGTSLLQGGVALRGLPADYDRWAERAGASWSHRRLLPVLARVEADRDTGSTGVLGIRRSLAVERQPLHEAFLDGCGELGVPYCPDLNAQTATGVGLVPQARRGTVKETARRAYLDPARARPGLTLLAGTRATRLLLRGGRVEGVETVSAERGCERHLARHVVLTAGAVASAMLLLRSGVGEPAELRAAGLPVLVPLPGVGTRLRDHPAVWTSFGLRSGHGRPDPLWFQVMMRHTAEDGDGLPDLVLEMYHDFRLLPAPAALQRGVLVASLSAPRGTGRIRLDPRGPDGNPLIEFDYPAADLADLHRAVTFGHRVLRTTALLRLGAHAPRLVSVAGHGGRSDTLLPRALPVAGGSASPYTVGVQDVAGSAVTAHHLHGGCPMGPDPDRGDVVDERCEVHGVEGLHVGDTSVMPTPLRANTHLLALCVAERLGELFTRDPRDST
ncbi:MULTISPECIES: GMC family oxidoreductase [Kitasatospora]|uniref:GMC family oxidoreductase N-terminal domain-containing protein n=1 Tax=Kitasatospora cystarginea TaxID=58350 RepID=A0ABN3DD75_9ACTN